MLISENEKQVAVVSLGVSAADVQRAVVEAVLSSSIGTAIKNGIDSEIGKLSNSWDNPIQRVIRDVVFGVVRSHVISQYQDKVKAIVTEQLSDACLQKLVSKALDKLYAD